MSQPDLSDSGPYATREDIASALALGLTIDELRAQRAADDIPDFAVRNEGSIQLLVPNTDAAREWVSQHISEDAQRFCGGIVVESRYIDDIVQGIQGDGLTVLGN